jgi:uncharacterized membrane protein
MPILTSAFYFWHCYYMIDSKYHSFLGLFAVLMSGFFLSLAIALIKKVKIPTTMFGVMVGISLTFLTIAIPIQLDGNYITLSWAIQSSILIFLSFKLNYTKMRLGSYAIMLLTLFRILFIEYNSLSDNFIYRLERVSTTDFIPFFNISSIVILLSISCLFVNSWFLVKNRIRLDKTLEYTAPGIISIISNLLIIILLFVNASIYFELKYKFINLDMFYNISTESMKQFSYSAILILYSLGAIVTGLNIRSKSIRIFALCLFMTSVLKVFILDLSVLSGGYRILSFVLLGIILVGVSLIYQKYSYIINNQEAKNEN